jgi:hypothetical protein
MLSIFVYYLVAIGYGMVVSEREPSKFHWVAICSGVMFPIFVGVALANFLPFAPRKPSE